MPKHRLAFSKADTAKFISHLDLMRTFQRSFLRAGIAIKHTEGFNPHAFVSIPLPLSVGFSSGCEVLECQVLDTPLDQVPAKMNAALPAGITIQRCYEAVRPVKELCYVNYIVTLEYEGGGPLRRGERHPGFAGPGLPGDDQKEQEGQERLYRGGPHSPDR